MGGKIHNIRQALEEINRLPGTDIVRVSRFYRTMPVGKTDQDRFINAAVLIETALTPEELIQALLAVEQEMGRVRIEKWGPRIIDLDILFYNKTVIHQPDLTVPHPYLNQRLFVLHPLMDIAPEWVHPSLGLRPEEMIAAIHHDGREVEVVNGE